MAECVDALSAAFSYLIAGPRKGLCYPLLERHLGFIITKLLQMFGDNDGRFKQCRFNCYGAVIPRQIVKRSHSEAGDNGALPLLGQQLLPYTFFGSQWLFHLMRGEKLRGKIFL